MRDRSLRSVLLAGTVCLGILGAAGVVFGAAAGGGEPMPTVAASAGLPAVDYPTLVKLFEDWRAFERPVMRKGVPDYTASAMAAKAAALPAWRKRLGAIDAKSWPVNQQIDYALVKAEMNGLDFNLRVLRPWARDPAFYVSIWPDRTDVPSREAPASYPEIQLYNYHFPLAVADQRELTATIGMIPAFLTQARENLKNGNARDLWVYGQQELQKQSRALASLESGTLRVSTLEGRQQATLEGASPELRLAVTNARKATDDFIAWVAKLALAKTGKSGVGKENYTWYQQNVHFLPYTWDQEVAVLRLELERALASLKLEEFNNRNLPPLDPQPDADAYDKMARAHLDKFISFLVDQKIIPDKPYIRGALEPRMPRFSPGDRGSFFTRVMQREPMTMLAHDYHWIDLARMRDEPNASPIRRVPSLSNIWDNRAEGFATAFEEIVMHAGLYDDNPRAKELVWVLVANRAARGLASLYVQANEFTLQQGGHFQGEWTPRGWSNASDDLTAFEQLLYLRQPGYGTSYITGKVMFDQLLAKYAHQQDLAHQPFVLSDFMDRFNNEGMIPVTLMEKELIKDDTPQP